MKKMLILAALVAGAGLIATSADARAFVNPNGKVMSAGSSAGAAAEARLAKCRADLVKSGKWNQYPQGYCRNKTGAPR
jgi:hypothetical protein